LNTRPTTYSSFTTSPVYKLLFIRQTTSQRMSHHFSIVTQTSHSSRKPAPFPQTNPPSYIPLHSPSQQLLPHMPTHPLLRYHPPRRLIRRTVIKYPSPSPAPLNHDFPPFIRLPDKCDFLEDLLSRELFSLGQGAVSVLLRRREAVVIRYFVGLVTPLAVVSIELLTAP
jgi:hypothetical protein